jgi:ABC-2 type transport system permease protein
VGIFLGAAVSNVETAGKVAPLIMPLTMISKVFVPTDGMPAVLRTISNWNPVSAAVPLSADSSATRGAPAADAAWPIAHPVIATIGRSLLLLVTFMPLAAHRFQGGAS